MAMMSDFAALPQRQKVMIFLIVGGVLGAIYWKVGYRRLTDNLSNAEQQHEQKAAQNKQLEKDIPEFELLKTRMVSIKRMIDENQKALPTEAELPAFFETLNRKVIESGIEVTRSSIGHEEPVERFLKVPISYEIQGTFVQIKKFFASLIPKKKRSGQDASGDQAIEERERIVSIENLSLTNPVVKNREIVLTAKFTASTFRQEEAKGAEPIKRAAPAPAPAPAPGAPPPGPPPPTSTPKGAKAATEKALEKGDQRNRNAGGVNEAKTPGGTERMKGGL